MYIGNDTIYHMRLKSDLNQMVQNVEHLYGVINIINIININIIVNIVIMCQTFPYCREGGHRLC
jgi:UDP-3-O-acyl-N-acetylglucosamine deacetylase